MTIIALNVLSEQSNHGVVQMPERQFPGAVIQGDSLAILCEEAREISERLKALSNPDDDILFLAQEHQEKLLSRLLHYQKVLTRGPPKLVIWSFSFTEVTIVRSNPTFEGSCAISRAAPSTPR